MPWAIVAPDEKAEKLPVLEAKSLNYIEVIPFELDHGDVEEEDTEDADDEDEEGG